MAARLTASLALALLSLSGAAAAQGGSRDAVWNELLHRHVIVIESGHASRVDYSGFARDRGELDAYVAALERVSREQFDSWSKPAQMAFLINAYNAFTVEKVLERYPALGSIRDFGRVFGNPWRDAFFTLLGQPCTLDRIEHEWLRAPGVYDEPRIHYALNCAAIGCPMLREEAYAAERLDAQLEDQARRFLSDRRRNRYDPARGALEVSRIFDWYRGDWSSGRAGIFGRPAARSLEEYFARYADLLADDPAARERIATRRAPIRFLDYDWTLNDWRGE